MSIQTTPTAPLSPAASAALARLERAFRPLDLVSLAASDYRAAESRANELIRSAQVAPMSDLHADDLAHYVDLMAGYKATLAAAGRLDLIGGA
jgi:hypothetical protein